MSQRRGRARQQQRQQEEEEQQEEHQLPTAAASDLQSSGGGLAEARRLWGQALLGCGSLSAQQQARVAQHISARCGVAMSPAQLSDALQLALDGARTQLLVKRVLSECGGQQQQQQQQQELCLVNALQDASAVHGAVHSAASKADALFMQNAIDAVAKAPRAHAALRLLLERAPKSFTTHRAQSLVATLVARKFLEVVPQDAMEGAGDYVLGVRALAEMGPYLQQRHAPPVCKMCSSHAFFRVACRKCKAVVHVRCVTAWFARTGARTCPSCRAEWELLDEEAPKKTQRTEENSTMASQRKKSLRSSQHPGEDNDDDDDEEEAEQRNAEDDEDDEVEQPKKKKVAATKKRGNSRKDRDEDEEDDRDDDNNEEEEEEAAPKKRTAAKKKKKNDDDEDNDDDDDAPKAKKAASKGPGSQSGKKTRGRKKKVPSEEEDEDDEF